MIMPVRKNEDRLGTDWHLSLNMAETTFQWVNGMY